MSLDAEEFQTRFETLAANVDTYVRGKPDTVRTALVCLLAEGHLLIEDYPGLAKTSLARAIAQSVEAGFQRIQFTPDLLPADVTGTQVYRPGQTEPQFRQGPVFTNILLGDEINRASPKTQSALLEVMAERQVTTDGMTRPVPRPFLCIATQNPVEHQGTYPLPEAQLDRFAMRISIGYPEPADEVEVVEQGLARRTPEQLPHVLTLAQLTEMIETVPDVHVAPALQQYIVAITRATRTATGVRLGVSPRGSVTLALCAQARAASRGRRLTDPDDVKAVAIPVLAHRMIMASSALADRARPEDVIAKILTDIPIPPPRNGWT